MPLASFARSVRQDRSNAERQAAEEEEDEHQEVYTESLFQ